jgi:hypothetical protein
MGGSALSEILAVMSISGIKSSSQSTGISRIPGPVQLNYSFLEIQVTHLAF